MSSDGRSPQRSDLDPPPLYAIADAAALAPESLADGVELLAAGGLRWIQVRAKALPDDRLYAEMVSIDRRLAGSGVRLWMNDRADLAALLGWSGLHLGQDDLSPAAARRVVPDATWIGRSTHDLEQVEEADADRAVDLVAIGPIYPTRSKANPDPVVGLDLVRRARRSTGKPLVAIGGITAERVDEVLAAGADSAVVLGALCHGDLRTNLARFRRFTEAPG